MDDEGKLVLTPKRIIYVRERRMRSRFIQEYLIIWIGFPAKDSTWEEEKILQYLGLDLLGDTQYQEGRTMMSPST
jgi:hypothetical protein